LFDGISKCFLLANNSDYVFTSYERFYPQQDVYGVEDCRFSVVYFGASSCFN